MCLDKLNSMIVPAGIPFMTAVAIWLLHLNAGSRRARASAWLHLFEHGNNPQILEWAERTIMLNGDVWDDRTHAAWSSRLYGIHKTSTLN